MQAYAQKTMFSQQVNFLHLMVNNRHGDIPPRRARGGLPLSLGDLCTQYPSPVTKHTISEVGTQ